MKIVLGSTVISLVYQGKEVDHDFVGSGEAAKSCKQKNDMFESLFYIILVLQEVKFGAVLDPERARTRHRFES